MATASLSHSAPIPPPTLFGRQEGVAGLKDSRSEDVEAANILLLMGEAAKVDIKGSWVLLRKLGHRVDAKNLEIMDHCGSHGHQVFQLAFLQHRISFQH
jgi:hypothetical protein